MSKDEFIKEAAALEAAFKATAIPEGTPASIAAIVLDAWHIGFQDGAMLAARTAIER
jgi:hypothetical protein